MWPLLKADLSYKKHIFFLAYGAMTLLFLIIYLWESTILSLPRAGSVQSLSWNFPKWVGAIGLLVLNNRSEKQDDRFHALSPISLKQIAMVRLAPGAIFLIGLGILFYLNFIIFNYPFTYPLKHQLWLAGLLLSFNAIILIGFDLNRLKSSKPPSTEWILFPIAVCYYASFYMRKYYLLTFDFPGGEFVLSSLFLTTYFLSAYVFSRRQSYLT